MNPKETTQQRISRRAADRLHELSRRGESLAETLDRILSTERKEEK